MSFIDQINHAWESGKEPVRKGVDKVLEKAKTFEGKEVTNVRMVENEKDL